MSARCYAPGAPQSGRRSFFSMPANKTIVKMPCCKLTAADLHDDELQPLREWDDEEDAGLSYPRSRNQPRKRCEVARQSAKRDYCAHILVACATPLFITHAS